MENVKNLVSKKFMPEFRKWVETMESFGYKNFWKVLNAKNFGVPQNRERVFMISILDRGGSFIFPEGFPLVLRLKDILEKNVPESYYLKQKQIDHIIAHCERKVAEGCGFKTNFQDENGISGAIKTKEGSREYDTYIKEEIISRQDAIEYTPTKDGGNIASALTCGGTPPCYYEAKTGKRYRIRKLTERECFRLMGVDDGVIDIIQSATTSKGKQAISKSQQYKMAGNSIVVDCLYYIFENLYINTPQPQEGVQLSLFDFL